VTALHKFTRTNDFSTLGALSRKLFALAALSGGIRKSFDRLPFPATASGPIGRVRFERFQWLAAPFPSRLLRLTRSRQSRGAYSSGRMDRLPAFVGWGAYMIIRKAAVIALVTLGAPQAHAGLVYDGLTKTASETISEFATD
jgi:hypothetical protein